MSRGFTPGLSRMFVEQGVERIDPEESDLNRLFEERTLRVGGDRRGNEANGFKPQP